MQRGSYTHHAAWQLHAPCSVAATHSMQRGSYTHHAPDSVRLKCDTGHAPCTMHRMALARTDLRERPDVDPAACRRGARLGDARRGQRRRRSQLGVGLQRHRAGWDTVRGVWDTVLGCDIMHREGRDTVPGCVGYLLDVGPLDSRGRRLRLARVPVPLHLLRNK
jgi:hypothetical protein